MHVDQIVGDLIMRTNCVVVPGFGGFVANTHPARIDYTKGVIFPPHKAVTFNRNLQNNDGLLVAEYARRNSTDYTSAEKTVIDFGRSALVRLKSGERIAFDKVGYLYTDENGSIRFEQDRFFNLLMESYGMSSVHFIPEATIIEEKNEELVEKQQISESPQKEAVAPIIPINRPQTSTWKKVAKYAVAAALLPVLFYSFWIPTTTDVLQSRVLVLQDFNPLKNKVAPIYSKTVTEDLSIEKSEVEVIDFELLAENLPEGVSTYSFALNEDTYVPVKLRNTSSPFENLADAVNQTGAYHLIVGCFSSDENATKLIAELKNQGYAAYQVDINNGLHRISAAAGNTSSEFSAMRDALKTAGYSSWVLKN
jgi:hypothetical protein